MRLSEWLCRHGWSSDEASKAEAAFIGCNIPSIKVLIAYRTVRSYYSEQMRSDIEAWMAETLEEFCPHLCLPTEEPSVK